MTAAHGIIASLRAFGAEVWAEGGTLRIKAPPGMLTPSLREALERLKPQILAALGGADQPVGDDSDARALVVLVRCLAAIGVELPELDHFFERASIVEHDGTRPRDEAELRAARESLELGRQRRAGGAA